MVSKTQKVIWLTGASSGIGEALARELARKGHRLILSARNISELERVRSQLAGANHLIVPLDLSNPSVFQDITLRVIEQVGHIDILINNGGISQRSLAMETELKVDQRLFDVNFFGAVGLTKSVLPHFIKNGGGHIVVVSSVTGKYGTPYRSGYAASKHALHGYFDSLRAELFDKNVPVTIICPGFIKTNITLHALTGDGNPLGTMDKGTSSGMDVNVFAKKMVKAIECKKREVHIGGPKEMFGIFMKRFFPGIFASMITKINVR